jgi:chromosome segregation ATPase
MTKMANGKNDNVAAQVIIPNPDPSVITREAIDRAVENSEAVVGAKIDGMEKAVQVFQADLTRVPTQLDRAIAGLRDLFESKLSGQQADIKYIHESLDRRGSDIREQVQHLRDLVFGKIEELSAVTMERFAGVGSQFSERDTRTDQRAGDTKLAVDAAFAAAKEATAKIELGFTKQIDSMTDTIDTKTGNLASGLGDLKDRITALENRAQATDPAVTATLTNIASELSSLRTSRDTRAGADPALMELLNELKVSNRSLGTSRDVTSGASQQFTSSSAMLIIIVSALAAVASAVFNIAHH